MHLSAYHILLVDGFVGVGISLWHALTFGFEAASEDIMDMQNFVSSKLASIYAHKKLASLA